MATRRDDVNWNDTSSIWARITSAKSAVTRACTAIDKLLECDFIYSTPAACETAQKRLSDAFDFCVELHDRWSDLESEAGNASAAETAANSLSPYEDKQFAALQKLASYVKKHSAKAQASPPAASSGEASAIPKLSTCKLLFPDKLLKTNTPSEFRLWVSAFRRFHEASNLKSQPIATQQGYLLQALSSELQDIVEQKLTATMQIFGPAGCMDVLEGEFRTLYPIFNRRVDFFQVKREQGESPEEFFRRLNKLAQMADLGAMTIEELTTFRFIAACEDKQLRKQIFDLKRKDATAVREAIAQFQLQQKAEEVLQVSEPVPVAAVTQQKQGWKGQRGQKQRPIPPQLLGKCTSCGDSSHMAPTCNVKKRGLKCSNCGRPGHLAKVCFSIVRKQSMQSEAKPVRAVTHQETSEEEATEPWVNRLTLSISHKNGSFTFNTFPDTGSAATLIASDLAKKYGIKASRPSNRAYVSVNGDPVPTSGTAQVTLSISDRSISTLFVISSALTNEIIIGRDDLKKLGVIPKQFPNPIYIVSENRFSSIKDALLRNNQDVLTDELPSTSMNTGCVAMKIHLTPGEINPFRISTAHQIPLHWKEKAERIVKKLIDSGVIKQENDPTEWCAPGFFVAKKNGDLRLVIDYTRLNKYVRRPVHTFPSTQEILSGIDPQSKVFAKLDATQGYHQVPLDDESSKLTTFLLPSGRFRFLRAPMGLSCSSDEFCRRSDLIVEGLQGVRKLVDDILVQAPDLETLQNRIKELLGRCRENNFTLSRKKLEIGESVEFAGQIISHNGVQPNPDYLQGIRDFPRPKSVPELRSFLGMVNQLSTYHPGIAKHTGILQLLLKKNTAFTWLEEHQAAFHNLKSDLLSALSLNHFDQSWDTRLVTDASRLHGLGFVLMQSKGDKVKVIQCGSRSLASAEKNYSTLELELAAIVWAVQKCIFFLRGIERFEVVTDHRPLIGIFAKNLNQIDNKRIVRLREKIMDHPLEVKWVAGKDNIIADALSRAPAPTTDNTKSLPIKTCIAASQPALTQMVQCCQTDTSYRQIVDAFKQDKKLADLPPDHPACRMKQVWDRLSITDEGVLIVDENKLYLPPGSRKKVLQQLHEGHCGYNKTVQTARSLYFWPSMKYDIKDMIERCESCQQLRPSKPVEPFIQTKAKFPMEQISIDLFHVKGKTYIVIADRYSGYIWVEMLHHQDTKAVTDVLDKITRIFGVPLVCRTDGGPQFRGPFKNYCLEKGITHEQSSPYNPQSNGHAEAAVKTAKYLLLKTKPSTFAAALAAWRNTEREDKPSPNELMFCRKVRDGKAIIKSHLHPGNFEKMHLSDHESKKKHRIPNLIMILPQIRPSKSRQITRFQILYKATRFAYKIHSLNAGKSLHS